MDRQIAQATVVPPSGASNANDFQPQTRNPQADAVPTQPQTSNLQSPAASEVLGKQDIRIVVPNAGVVEASSGTRQVAVTDKGSDVWGFLLLAVLVLAVGSFLLRRNKSRPAETRPSTPAIETKPVQTTPKKHKSGKKTKHKRKRK